MLYTSPLVSKISRKVCQPVPSTEASGTNMPMVAGMDAMDWAKMMGSTPDIFTLMGRWLDWPPYIFRPTTRLAYCTGMRRSELSMNTIKATSSSIPATISRMNAGCSTREVAGSALASQPLTPSIMLPTMLGRGPRYRQTE